jgi:myosin heavy subunit
MRRNNESDPFLNEEKDEEEGEEEEERVHFGNGDNNNNNKIEKKLFEETRRQPTVLYKFKKDLQCLIDQLKQTKIQYIRCIKSNQVSSDQLFDNNFVGAQLKACGLLDTLKMFRQGLTKKISYSHFNDRYFNCLKIFINNDFTTINDKHQQQQQQQQSSMKQKTLEILNELIIFNKNDSYHHYNYKPGDTKLFLSEDLFKLCETIRSDIKYKLFKNTNNSNKIMNNSSSLSCKSVGKQMSITKTSLTSTSTLMSNDVEPHEAFVFEFSENNSFKIDLLLQKSEMKNSQQSFTVKISKKK